MLARTKERVTASETGCVSVCDLATRANRDKIGIAGDSAVVYELVSCGLALGGLWRRAELAPGEVSGDTWP